MSTITYENLKAAFEMGFRYAIALGIEQGEERAESLANGKIALAAEFDIAQPDKDQRIAELTAKIEELIAERDELKDELDFVKSSIAYSPLPDGCVIPDGYFQLPIGTDLDELDQFYDKDKEPDGWPYVSDYRNRLFREVETAILSYIFIRQKPERPCTTK